MTKKRIPRGKRSTKTSSGRTGENETPAAVALTVFWMLAALATLAAEIVWAIGSLARTRVELPLLEILPQLAAFIALVTGGCALLATPLVLKVRQHPPPPAVTWGVVVLGVIALGIGLIA